MRRTVSPRPQASVYIDNHAPVYDTLPRPFQPVDWRPTTPRASQEPTSMRRAVSPRPQAYSVYDPAPRPRAVSPRPLSHSTYSTYAQSRSPRPQVRLVSPRPSPHIERRIVPDVQSIMRRGMRGLSDGGGSSVLHGGMYA